MYRSREEYDRMAQLAISIYCDYQLTEFPIDARKLCEKMGVELVPYSAFSKIDRATLCSRSDYGFFVPILKDYPPRIFYNDDLRIVGSEERIRFYLLHELKHYADEDTDPDATDDDLADYFAKFMACPIPLLVVLGVTDPEEICSRFGVGYTVAEIVSSNILNRMLKCGTKIFNYEEELIRLLMLVWNCYRNRAITYALQKAGVKVIPTAGFGGESTWRWCFDGLPQNSSVAVTTNGILSDPEAMRLFIGGIDAMVHTIHPYAIIVCGKCPGWLDRKYPDIKIVHIPSYSQQWHNRRCA